MNTNRRRGHCGVQTSEWVGRYGASLDLGRRASVAWNERSGIRDDRSRVTRIPLCCPQATRSMSIHREAITVRDYPARPPRLLLAKIPCRHHAVSSPPHSALAWPLIPHGPHLGLHRAHVEAFPSPQEALMREAYHSRDTLLPCLLLSAHPMPKTSSPNRLSSNAALTPNNCTTTVQSRKAFQENTARMS